MIALLSSHLKYVGWLLVVALACVTLIEHDRHVRDVALLHHELASLQRTERVMADSIKTQRTVVLRDTLKLTRLVRDWQTVHDTAVVHLTDTVRVKEALAQADTTIRACRVTVADCTALNRLLSAQLAVKDSETTVLHSLIPSTMQRTKTALVWTAVGIGATLALHGVGVIK